MQKKDTSIDVFFFDYSVTPSLKMVISCLSSFSDLALIFPEAKSQIKSKNSSDKSAIETPSNSLPASKSIQVDFFNASAELLEILTVGTGEQKMLSFFTQFINSIGKFHH